MKLIGRSWATHGCLSQDSGEDQDLHELPWMYNSQETLEGPHSSHSIVSLYEPCHPTHSHWYYGDWVTRGCHGRICANYSLEGTRALLKATERWASLPREPEWRTFFVERSRSCPLETFLLFLGREASWRGFEGKKTKIPERSPGQTSAGGIQNPLKNEKFNLQLSSHLGAHCAASEHRSGLRQKLKTGSRKKVFLFAEVTAYSWFNTWKKKSSSCKVFRKGSSAFQSPSIWVFLAEIKIIWHGDVPEEEEEEEEFGSVLEALLDSALPSTLHLFLASSFVLRIPIFVICLGKKKSFGKVVPCTAPQGQQRKLCLDLSNLRTQW